VFFFGFWFLVFARVIDPFLGEMARFSSGNSDLLSY